MNGERGRKETTMCELTVIVERDQSKVNGEVFVVLSHLTENKGVSFPNLEMGDFDCPEHAVMWASKRWPFLGDWSKTGSGRWEAEGADEECGRDECSFDDPNCDDRSLLDVMYEMKDAIDEFDRAKAGGANA